MLTLVEECAGADQHDCNPENPAADEHVGYGVMERRTIGLTDLLKVSVTGSYTSNLTKYVTNWAIQRVSTPNCLIIPLNYPILTAKLFNRIPSC